MSISSNKFTNSFYQFVSRRRWMRRLGIIKLPSIGWYDTASGFRYAVSLNDWRGPSYHLINWGEETYENENKKALMAFLPDHNGIFIDIGANIGLFTFYYKRVKPDLKAFLFEPEPIAYECLTKTIAWNKINNVSLFPEALSNKVSSADFFIDGTNYGGHSLHETNILSEGDTVSGRIKVQTTTLDDYVKKQGLSEIHAIKIDVQGNEFEVLSGAIRTLTELKPVLLVECYFRDLCSERSILKILEKINQAVNYQIYEPKTKKIFTISELLSCAILKTNEDPSSFSDFLFVPDNKRNREIVLVLNQSL